MSQPDKESFQNYDAFWLFYVREHSSPANRVLHFLGTTLALAVLGYAIAAQLWWLLVAVPVAGYSLAWSGHLFVERNKPASFKHPGWSFISDLRMWFLILTFRMGKELDRARSAPSD